MIESKRVYKSFKKCTISMGSLVAEILVNPTISLNKNENLDKYKITLKREAFL